MGKETKIEIQDPFSTKVIIGDRGYNSNKSTRDLSNTPYYFTHEPKRWLIRLGYKSGYTLTINGMKFENMLEAPMKALAELTRSAISMKMDGPIKSAKFALLRKGE